MAGTEGYKRKYHSSTDQSSKYSGSLSSCSTYDEMDEMRINESCCFTKSNQIKSMRTEDFDSDAAHVNEGILRAVIRDVFVGRELKTGDTFQNTQSGVSLQLDQSGFKAVGEILCVEFTSDYDFYDTVLTMEADKTAIMKLGISISHE